MNQVIGELVLLVMGMAGGLAIGAVISETAAGKERPHRVRLIGWQNAELRRDKAKLAGRAATIRRMRTTILEVAKAYREVAKAYRSSARFLEHSW